MPKRKPKPIELPVSDNAEITQTTVYPSIEAMFSECFAAKDWFKDYSPNAQEMIKFTAYTAISETLRLVAFRMNAEQNDAVWDDIGRELLNYDLFLQHAAAKLERAHAELH